MDKFSECQMERNDKYPILLERSRFVESYPNGNLF